jgi:hypothetical protein
MPISSASAVESLHLRRPPCNTPPYTPPPLPIAAAITYNHLQLNTTTDHHLCPPLTIHEPLYIRQTPLLPPSFPLPLTPHLLSPFLSTIQTSPLSPSTEDLAFSSLLHLRLASISFTPFPLCPQLSLYFSLRSLVSHFLSLHLSSHSPLRGQVIIPAKLLLLARFVRPARDPFAQDPERFPTRAKGSSSLGIFSFLCSATNTVLCPPQNTDRPSIPPPHREYQGSPSDLCVAGLQRFHLTMPSYANSTSFLTLAILLVLFARPASAFGAGNIASVSRVEGINCA